MMKCPRCGFTQPRDRYCAQCGVDVITYKPPKKPLFDQLVQSSLVQLVFVGLLIFFVASSLIKKENHSMRSRVEYLKGNLQISSEKDTSTSVSKSNDTSTSPPTQSSSTPAPPPAQPTATENHKELASTPNPTPVENNSASGNENPNLDKAKTTNKSPENNQEAQGNFHTIKISYYEVSNHVRELIINESGKAGQFNNYEDYMAGLLPRFRERLNAWIKDKELILPLFSEVKKVENRKPLQWFTGLQSANTENHIGFRHDLEITELDPGVYRINLEIVKSWKDNSDASRVSMLKTSYPVQIDMTKTSACFVGGILARQSPLENEDYLSSIPPFGILKSRAFRDGQTQFITVLEIEN